MKVWPFARDMIMITDGHRKHGARFACCYPELVKMVFCAELEAGADSRRGTQSARMLAPAVPHILEHATRPSRTLNISQPIPTSMT